MIHTSLRSPIAPPAPTPTTTPAPTRQARFYVPALDGLRVMAFLGVWCFHAAGIAPFVKARPLLTTVASVGMYGVPLFFVLSAFLITRLLLMEKERNGKVDLRAYYARRTLRIWPLYFLVSAVGLVVAHLLGLGLTRESVVPILTFTANFAQGGGHLSGTLGPLWSLSVEEQFYLVWPLVLAFVSRAQLRNVCCGMVAVALASRVGIFAASQSWSVAYTATTSHLDSLALGTLLALNFDRLKGFSPAKGLSLMGLCVAGMFAVNVAFPSSNPLGALLAYTAVPFLCAAIMALAIGTQGTFLARPRFAAFGRLTFGLYMWHVMPLLYIIAHGYGTKALPFGFLASVAIAALTYYGVERPFLSLKHRFERVQTRLA